MCVLWRKDLRNLMKKYVFEIIATVTKKGQEYWSFMAISCS